MNSSLITRGFIFTAICLALGVILNQEYFNFIPWYGLMAILFFSGILFLFVLQIVEIKNVKKLFQKIS
jgi:hypothetical protein